MNSTKKSIKTWIKDFEIVRQSPTALHTCLDSFYAKYTVGARVVMTVFNFTFLSHSIDRVVVAK